MFRSGHAQIPSTVNFRNSAELRHNKCPRKQMSRTESREYAIGWAAVITAIDVVILMNTLHATSRTVRLQIQYFLFDCLSVRRLLISPYVLHSQHLIRAYNRSTSCSFAAAERCIQREAHLASGQSSACVFPMSGWWFMVRHILHDCTYVVSLKA